MAGGGEHAAGQAQLCKITVGERGLRPARTTAPAQVWTASRHPPAGGPRVDTPRLASRLLPLLHMRFLLPVALSALALTLACTDDPEPDPPDPTLTTWYQDVAPILAQHCMSCHRSGGVAPFSLEDYEVAAANAPRLLEAVEAGLMPPWDAVAAPDCAPPREWKHDPRLSDAQIAVLRDWITDGTPVGTVADLPHPPGDTLRNPTHMMTPVVPFTTTGDHDQFVCFVLDPATSADRWLTGFEVIPGNPKVVHHVLVFGVTPAAATAARDADLIGKPIPDCAGVFTDPATGAPLTYLIGAWTPGSQPLDTGDLGLAVPAGGAFLLQMHYHPGGAPTNGPDATALKVRLDDHPPSSSYLLGGWGNAGAAPALLPGPNDRGAPEFRIPANVAEHTETMRFVVPGTASDRARALFAYPHMHYIGTKMSVTIERSRPPVGVPSRECLVNVSQWDFDWQRHYEYDAPVAELPLVRGGDVIEVTCTFDNTLANPFVRRMLEELGLQEPIEVTLGEQSLDEMCLGMFGLVPDPAP